MGVELNQAIALQMPEAMAKLFASFDDAVIKGGLSGTSADFKKLTGVEPRGFEDWLQANVGALAA